MRERLQLAPVDRQDRRLAHVGIAVLLAAMFVIGGACRVHAQDNTTTGTLVNPNDALTVTVINVPALSVQLGGTWSGSVVFEASSDNAVTWRGIAATSFPDGGIVAGSSVNGQYLVTNPGWTQVRARAVSMSAGSVAVTATRGFAVAVNTAASAAASSTSSLVTVRTVPQQKLLLSCNALRTTNCQ